MSKDNNSKLTVKFCLSEHKKAFENWNEGEVIKVWYDENNILCIQYASGQWWHYTLSNNQLEWW